MTIDRRVHAAERHVAIVSGFNSASRRQISAQIRRNVVYNGLRSAVLMLHVHVGHY